MPCANRRRAHKVIAARNDVSCGQAAAACSPCAGRSSKQQFCTLGRTSTRQRQAQTLLLYHLQAINHNIQQIGQGSIEDRIVAAHQYASMLEAEESRYRALVGDPHSSPNLRSHYTVGKLLTAIKVRQQPRIQRNNQQKLAPWSMHLTAA